jgi:hypothetical protein
MGCFACAGGSYVRHGRTSATRRDAVGPRTAASRPSRPDAHTFSPLSLLSPCVPRVSLFSQTAVRVHKRDKELWEAELLH